jgi:hypothetical protein
MMDKRIAELRGEECWNDDNPNWSFCDTTCDKCNTPMAKPYSTDIRYAMELWGEMKAAGMSLQLNSYGDIVRCVLYKPYVTTKGNRLKELYADASHTEAEAIAGAYLKWREDG